MKARGWYLDDAIDDALATSSGMEIKEWRARFEDEFAANRVRHMERWKAN